MSYEMMVSTRQAIQRATLRVAEIFGPTFQGEGPTTGRLAHFVRLSGCNLACDWCDTPYTWDWQGKLGKVYSREAESTIMTVADIRDQVLSAGRVVITGGEPLTQATPLTVLANALVARHQAVEIETNGTRPLPPTIDRKVSWNISPKLAGSGNSLKTRQRGSALASYATRNAVLKFVITDETDVAEAMELSRANGFGPDRVWFMPQGRTDEELALTTPTVRDAALALGVNFTGRLHVALWGNERGH